MRYVNIYSDFEFDNVACDLTIEARAAAWEIWRDDLPTTLPKDKLLTGANSILQYFGSKVLLTDVQWDEQQNCYLWEVEFEN